ncbi:MAG: DVU0772 family protein [Nitrospirota bacterium]
MSGSDEEKSIFDLQDLRSLRKRPDILSRIKWDVTPLIVMEPRFQARPDDLQKLRDITGYLFYIETESERPSLMLMRIGKSDITSTAGMIEEIPFEMVQRAIDNPLHPPVHGMYAITEEIKDWLRKELSL